MVYIAVVGGAVWMLYQIIATSEGAPPAQQDPILVFLVLAFAAVVLFLRYRVQAIAATSLRIRAEGVAYWPLARGPEHFAWGDVVKIRDVPPTMESPVARIEIELRSGRVITAPYAYLTMDYYAWVADAAQHIPMALPIEPEDSLLAQYRAAWEESAQAPRYLMLSCFDRKSERAAWNEALTGFALHTAVAAACLIPAGMQLPFLLNEPIAARVAIVLLTLPFGCFLGVILLRDVFTVWHGHLMATLFISPRRGAWITTAGRAIQSGPWRRFRAIPLHLQAENGARLPLSHRGLTPSTGQVEEIGALLAEGPALRRDVARYVYLKSPSRRGKCVARVMLVAAMVSVALAGAVPTYLSAGVALSIVSAWLAVESVEAWQYWRIGRD